MPGELRMAVLRLLHSALAWLLAHLRAVSSRLEQLRERLATSSRSDSLPPLSPREALGALWTHVEAWLTAQASRIVASVVAQLRSHRGLRVAFARASIAARAAKAKLRRSTLRKIVFSPVRSSHARAFRAAVSSRGPVLASDLRAACDAVRFRLARGGEAGLRAVASLGVAAILLAGKQLRSTARALIEALRRHAATYHEARLRAASSRMPAARECAEATLGPVQWLVAPREAAEPPGEPVGLAELMDSDSSDSSGSSGSSDSSAGEAVRPVGLGSSGRGAGRWRQRDEQRRAGSGFADAVKVAAACVTVVGAIAAAGAWSGRMGDQGPKTVMTQPSTAAPSPTPVIVEAAAPVEAVPRIIPLSQRNPITGPDRPPLPFDEAGPYGSRRTTGTYEVALTFDDGPDPRYTPVVLELLRSYHVKATFCLIGVNVIQFPELVRAIVAEGHTLCNHSWVHDTGLGNRGPSTIVSDMVRTNEAILAAAPGSRVSYFRHPGGMWTQAAVNSAQQLGMTSLHWDVDPRDWLKPGPRAISNTVTGSTQPGSIVLLHDGGGDRLGTVEALRSILPNLVSRLRLVALPPGIDPPRLYGIHLPVHAGQQ